MIVETLYTVAHMSLDSFLVADALIASGVIVASVIFTHTIGKYAIVPALTALGFGAAFASIVPYQNRIPGLSSWSLSQQSIVVFSLVTILAFFLFRRHSFFDPSGSPSTAEKIVFGLVLGGCILAIVGSFLPTDVVHTLTPQVKMLFVDDLAKTLWISAPIVVFGVMRGR